MTTLLGAIIALGNMAGHSELIVMQSAGLSRFKIGLAVMKTTLPLVLFIMILGEWGVPQTETFVRNMRTQARSGGQVLAVKNNIWAKEGNRFVYIKRISNDTTLNDVYIYQFDENRQLQQFIHANSARYEDNQWIFTQVNTSKFIEGSITTESRLRDIWHTTLTPDKLDVVSLIPTSLTIAELLRNIKFLKSTGQDSKKFELTFWRKVFQPISVSVMMLFALSFVFGPLRNVSAGLRIFLGICSGFAFHVINETFGPFSLIYSLPPLLGALMPSLVFMLVNWWLLTRKAS